MNGFRTDSKKSPFRRNSSSFWRSEPSTDWLSMSAVLQTWPTVTQNSPFLHYRWP